MSLRNEQNRITFLRHGNASSGIETSMAEIDELKRRRYRFDVWLFLSVWALISAATGLAICYD